MAERKWSEKQLEILNAGTENLLVPAAAGAGKTSVLVEKIYRLVTDPKSNTDIDRLLVMTFTNAAAAEMRERLAGKLSEELEKNPDNRRLQRQQMLIHNAMICTIDSFCVSVVREFFNAADIDPAFRIGSTPEFKLLEEDVMKALLEEKYAEGDEDFLDFVEGYASSKSDDSVSSMIMRLANSAKAHSDPQGWLNKMFREMTDPNAASSIEELDKLEYMQFLEGYTNSVAEDAIKQAQLGLRDISTEPGQDKYVEMFRNDTVYFDSIIQAKGYQAKQTIISQSLTRMPNQSKKDPIIDTVERCRAIRNGYKSVLDDLKKFYTMSPDEVILSTKLSEAKGAVCVSLAIEYLDRLWDAKQDRNIIDFNDLEHLTLQILTDTEEATGRLVPSRQALTLRERFDWVFVDEYQDSNEIQEELVNAIAGDAGRYPYTFMVGDVKQSIYKFRMAKPELFMHRYEEYHRDPAQGRVIVLDNNYRSGSNVLESTNDIFRRAMRKCVGGVEYDDEASLKAGTDSQRAMTSPATKVCIVEGNGLDEAEAAAQMILSYVGDGGTRKYSDIAVLIRTRAVIREYRDTFEKYGIPVITSDSSGFLETFEIRTVLDYLRILDNPAQDIPFVGVLASVIGGLSNEELALMRVETDRALSFYDAARYYAQNGRDDVLKGKLADFFGTYDSIRSMNLCRDIDRCIEQIYEQTGFYSFCRTLKGGAARISNLDMLTVYAAEYERSSYTGLFSFVRYVEELKRTQQDLDEAVNAEAANAVSIMTIHASKGLEYPVVIVGGMGHEIKNLDASKGIIASVDFGLSLPAVDTERMVKTKPLKYQITSKRMKIDLLGEELRLLYVAMTRAREELVMIGKISSRSKKSLDEIIRDWDGKQFTESYIMNCSTYFDFVMPTVLEEKEHFTLKKIYKKDAESGEDTADENIDEKAAEKLTNENDERINETELEQQKKIRAAAELLRTMECDSPDSEVMKELEFVYPYSDVMRIPSKLSVSDIKKKHMMDEFEDDENKPAFLIHNQVKAASGDTDNIPTDGAGRKSHGIEPGKGGVPAGAIYGTLVHKVMQFLPFDLAPEGVEQFIGGLVERQIITSEESELVPIRKISRFLKSDLAHRMSVADGAGKLRREQPFIMGIKACEVDREQYGDSEMLIPVQGVIDCFFEEDGELCILDYKTDKVADAQELKRMYKAQLDLYAQAAENILGKKVAEKVLYSFSLEETIIL